MKFKSSGGRRRVKRNPARRKVHTKRRRVKHNPAPSHVSSRRHHKRRRSIRRNPSGVDFKALALDVGAIGAGMLGGVYANNLAAKWLPARFRGLGSIAAGVGLLMLAGRSQILERAALGAAGMGLLDIVRNNVPALVPLSAEDAGYLLGNAAAYDENVASLLGLDTGAVPMGADGIPSGVIPNVFGLDTGAVPMGEDGIPEGVIPNVFGLDTGAVPMGEDGEGDGLFEDDGF